MNEVDLAHYRWTVDEPEDYEFVKRIYEALYPENTEFSMSNVLKFLGRNPELKTLNTQYESDAGMEKSFEAEKVFLKIKK